MKNKKMALIGFQQTNLFLSAVYALNSIEAEENILYNEHVYAL